MAATPSALNPNAREWKHNDETSIYIYTYPQMMFAAPVAAATPHHGNGGDGAIVEQTLPRRSRPRRVDHRGRKTSTVNKVWVPKEKSDGGSTVNGGSSAEVGGSSSPPPEKTTVMIKNIPNQYRRESFMSFLDKQCLERHLEYDFLYLPMDFETKNNLGYAFVNLTSASMATRVKIEFKDLRWSKLRTESGFFTSRKRCEVTWAKIQGKANLVNHFKRSYFECDTKDYLPVIFSPPRNGSPDNLAEPKPVGNLVGQSRHARLNKA